MKILIPNATGPDNMGDQAILTGLLSCIAEAFPTRKLTILTSSPERYKAGVADKIDYNIYMWCVFENTNTFVRAWRLLCLLYLYVAYKYNFPVFFGGRLDSIVREYKTADLIVFAGGGYLRTNYGFTQSLNLFMHLVMFKFAKVSKAKQILAPASFGPFAYKWQEQLFANVLSKLDLLCVREGISLRLLQPRVSTPVLLSTDTALFMEPIARDTKVIEEPIIGVSVRVWGDAQLQKSLSNAYVYALSHFTRKFNARVQPIIQVDGAEFGVGDNQITNELCQKLNSEHVTVLPPIVLESVEHSLEVYAGLSMHLGMRMHSNIFAFVAGVPFVAISYEHKTEGICKTLGLLDFCVSASNATGERLFQLLCKRYEVKVDINDNKQSSQALIQYRTDLIKYIRSVCN